MEFVTYPIPLLFIKSKKNLKNEKFLKKKTVKD